MPQHPTAIVRQPAIAKTKDGQPIDAYTLAAGRLRMRVLNLGGVVTHLYVPDRQGNVADVTLGFDDEADYERADNPYLGALIGRVGNRITAGRFSLDGHPHQLSINNGPNHLHGGTRGYDKRLWTVAENGPSSLVLTLNDPDGAEGYPGTLDVRVVYTLRDDGDGGGGSRGMAWRIDYEVTCAGRATPHNLTQHIYFNLHDAGASTIHDHVLELDAERYTPVVGDALLPTGEVAPVAGTPYDFTRPKPIGRDIAQPPGTPGGFDNNFVLRSSDGALARAARVVEPVSGRTLECWTTEPGIQFYSGNFLDGSLVGKGGTRYQKQSGLCLETQHFPDSVNHPAFPSTILRPGQTYRSSTEYRFGTE